MTAPLPSDGDIVGTQPPDSTQPEYTEARSSFSPPFPLVPGTRLVDGVVFDGQKVEVPYGTPVGSVIKRLLPNPDQPVLAALVQHRCVGLNHPVCAPTTIVPIDYTTRQGVLVYRRTASLILLEAVRQLYPGVRVTIGQALANGYHYRVMIAGKLKPEHVAKIKTRMRELVAQDFALRTETVTIGEARSIFAGMGFEHKLRVLQTYWAPFVTLVWCGGVCDVHRYPVAPSTGAISHFELDYYEGGLILRFPHRGKPRPAGAFHDSPKLFQVYTETRKWNELLGVESVGQLNEITIRGEANEVIRVSEGLHEKKIAQIADKITQESSGVRLVLIAGPSASGKTTFAKRLSLQLLVNGVRPIALSMDNFYVNREDTPKDDSGAYDFEAIEAIDLALFNEVLAKLLKGEEVLTPEFDFISGTRKPRNKWKPMQLKQGQVLVVEGIHGLNDRLTESVPAGQKYRVYVSALTQLCIDDHNRIFTSDGRFLRRIVRDRLFRGYRASTTIDNWPNVRRGEQRNIFPFQEKADVMFNSSLVYEQAVLKLYAERFLLEVPQDDPAFGEAYRLLQFVQTFVPIFEQSVPQISLLREFVGGSAFKY